MPTFPKQTLTVKDPGLNLTQPVANTPVLSGIAHGGSGVVNTVISVNSLDDVRPVIGYGPLAEDVALALSLAGGPVLAMIHNSVQDVSLSAVALTKLIGTGPSITATGSPYDRYSIRVEIVAGGTLTTATFRYTLDAWDVNSAAFTYSRTRVSASSFAIPNTGITLTFPAGTYVAGDVYTLVTIPQEVGTTDLALVAAVLEAAPSLDFHLWLLSGQQPDDATAEGVAVAFSGHLTTLTQSYRYVRGFVDLGSEDTAANVLSEAAAWTSTRVCGAYGYVLRTSLLPYEGYGNRKTSCASGIAVRAFGELISTDLARFASGPDQGVLKIYFDGFYNQLLDAAGLSTMRTWPGIAGFYIANGNLKAPFGSDYIYVQYGRVMDVACKTTYAAQLPYESESFRTTSTGGIDPRDAASVERAVTQNLTDVLLVPLDARGDPGLVSALNYSVDLTNNLVTSGQLLTKVGIRPLGYAKEILTSLFFTLTP